MPGDSENEAKLVKVIEVTIRDKKYVEFIGHAFKRIGARGMIQMVPEEVHSYWHLESEPDPPSLSNVWRIKDSTWLGSFAPRLLSNHEHHLLTFHDESAEVICRDLLFGMGAFDLESAIASFPQLAYAYLRRAMSREKKGKLDESAVDYKKYIAMSPDASSAEYARRCLSSLGRR